MGRDKLALDLGTARPLLRMTLDAVAAAELFDVVVVVTARERWPEVGTTVAASGLSARLELVEGGERRQDSVAAGLDACGAAEIICVHDAARPLCPPELFVACVSAAREHGAATAAVPLVDSVKRVDSAGRVVETLRRDELVAVQTPQAFRAELLREAHRRAREEHWEADDDCALVERTGAPVMVVPGDPANIKVTRPSDLALVRAVLTTGPP
jgi:2-C-methyl-D-erythritol 4-phosphate cytidylyltransferase